MPPRIRTVDPTIAPPPPPARDPTTDNPFAAAESPLQLMLYGLDGSGPQTAIEDAKRRIRCLNDGLDGTSQGYINTEYLIIHAGDHQRIANGGGAAKHDDTARVKITPEGHLAGYGTLRYISSVRHRLVERKTEAYYLSCLNTDRRSQLYFTFTPDPAAKDAQPPAISAFIKHVENYATTMHALPNVWSSFKKARPGKQVLLIARCLHPCSVAYYCKHAPKPPPFGRYTVSVAPHDRVIPLDSPATVCLFFGTSADEAQLTGLINGLVARSNQDLNRRDYIHATGLSRNQAWFWAILSSMEACEKVTTYPTPLEHGFTWAWKANNANLRPTTATHRASYSREGASADRPINKGRGNKRARIEDDATLSNPRRDPKHVSKRSRH